MLDSAYQGRRSAFIPVYGRRRVGRQRIAPRGWQWGPSRVLPSSCRYAPSCSAYAIEALERELFTQAIKLAHGNQTKAARWLGVSRITMREKLAQFGLNPREA